MIRTLNTFAEMDTSGLRLHYDADGTLRLMENQFGARWHYDALGILELFEVLDESGRSFWKVRIPARDPEGVSHEPTT